MLLLLVSLAMLSAACGQTNNYPSTIRYLQASQQTLVNTTAQIKDMLSRHTQQQSTSESLTNLMQLTLARQLMADLDIKQATNPSSPANSNCDCNRTVSALKQLETELINNKETIRNLTTDNERLKARCMNNYYGETIHNLTAVVERLAQHFNLTEIEYQVCGGSGWTRVAYLNMSDPSEQCPSGFRLYNQNCVRACGRTATTSGGCLSSVQFPTGMNYSEVCGRVTGYQYGGPDAFSTGSTNPGHVDGVILTYGSPRRHIWSFATANSKSSLSSGCPCSTGSSTSPPSFVGSDYFCESGYSGLGRPSLQLFAEPLWIGKGCSKLETPCCQATGIPWFHKKLNATTNDYMY